MQNETPDDRPYPEGQAALHELAAAKHDAEHPPPDDGSVASYRPKSELARKVQTIATAHLLAEAQLHRFLAIVGEHRELLEALLQKPTEPNLDDLAKALLDHAGSVNAGHADEALEAAGHAVEPLPLLSGATDTLPSGAAGELVEAVADRVRLDPGLGADHETRLGALERETWRPPQPGDDVAIEAEKIAHRVDHDLRLRSLEDWRPAIVTRVEDAISGHGASLRDFAERLGDLNQKIETVGDVSMLHCESIEKDVADRGNRELGWRQEIQNRMGDLDVRIERRRTAAVKLEGQIAADVRLEELADELRGRLDEIEPKVAAAMASFERAARETVSKLATLVNDFVDELRGRLDEDDQKNATARETLDGRLHGRLDESDGRNVRARGVLDEQITENRRRVEDLERLA